MENPNTVPSPNR
jgi:hypothetical protein